MQEHRSWFRNPDVWFPVILVVSGVLFFSDPLFSSKNFFFRDILNFHYPLHKVLIQAYARGEFPLWNPYVALGQPMLANPNYMAFYPSNLFHLLLPFNYAFKLHFIIHPLLGGLGLYFLQRRLGIGALASFAGSLVYQFSGTVLSFLNLYNIVPAVGLIPWLAWAFVGALKGDWWKRSLGFGAILAVQVAAFEPFTFQCVVLLVGGGALWHVMESKVRLKAVSEIVRVGAVGSVFSFALAAVQILPTLELLPRSYRAAGYDFSIFSAWSMHPIDFLNIVVPNLFGNPYTIDGSIYWGEPFHNERESYLVSVFLGSGTLFFVMCSILSKRKKLQLILTALTLVAAFLALGRFNPLYSWAYDHFPLIRLGRYPSKYFLLGTLALSVLTSLGLEAVLQLRKEQPPNRRKIVSIAVVGLVLGAGFLAVMVYWQMNPQSLENWIRLKLGASLAAKKDFPQIVSQLLASVRSTGFFFLISSALMLSFALSSRVSSLGGLLIVVLGAELLPANLGLSPLISGADVDFLPEVNAYLLENGPKEPFRVSPSALMGKAPDMQILAPNRSSAWLTRLSRMRGDQLHGIPIGIQYSLEGSVDGLCTKEAEELWRTCLRLPMAARLSLLARLNSPVILALDEIRDSRLKQLAVFDTRSPLRLHVYWLNDTVSRAYFASGLKSVSSPQQTLEKLLSPDFPYTNTVILENPAVAGRTAVAAAGTGRILEYQNQRVLCEVESNSPGYLVLLDSYYPGWQAYVDGKEARILAANYAFRAVEVRAGKHRVEFRYRPRSFYAGLSVTCLAIAFGTAVVFRGRDSVRVRDEAESDGRR